MGGARELVDEALACGILLAADGGQLRWRSPLGEEPPAALLARLRARRGELLAFLERRERAAALACPALLAAAELLWRAGVAGGEELRAAGETVTDAFWHACESGDFGPLADALADYRRAAEALAARREARGEAP